MIRKLTLIAAMLMTVVLGLSTATHAQTPDAKPFLHPLFTDNMVWQRDIAAPIWGWTTPGQKITVEMHGKKAQAVADIGGKWSAKLGPFAAGGPFDLTVSGGPQPVTLHNVLVGDVWVCSGQSNMEFGVGLGNNADKEIAAANYPNIRLLSIPHNVAITPQGTFNNTPQGTFNNAQWLVCSPTTINQGGWGGFSAAGYFFGRELNKRLGVPIGLIQSTWGGTIAEAWTSERGLAALPDFKPSLDQLNAMRTTKPEDRDTAIRDWYAKNDPGSVISAGAAVPDWAAATLDDTAWPTVNTPGVWEQAGVAELANFDGILWLRRSFELPAGAEGKDAILHLLVDDNDTTWVNGVQVGATEGVGTPRDYKVAANLLHAGQNIITVRVLDTGGGGGFYNADHLSLEIPGAQNVALAGPWHYRIGAAMQNLPGYPQSINGNPNVTTVLYNGMIAPIQPFAIKGAIWYQGEANAGRGEQYSRLLPALIGDWRSRFNSAPKDGNFPFYIVQLANFLQPMPSTGQSDWAELREAQSYTARTVPNTGIASIIDIGDAADIHPKDKQDVGLRLALNALALTYGQKIEYSGPVYVGMVKQAGAIRVDFTHADGLKFNGDKLLGFAIAGADGKYVEADAKIQDKSVLVSSPQVTDPVSVRYAWADNPICNLFNGIGLPASPFRTDSPLIKANTVAP